MFVANAIGHLGGDAELKTKDGKEFVTFRIAHADRWTDDAGNQHESTQWIDCVMNGRPAVLEYLKRGQQVFVSGNVSLRIYSSAKDRCMKPGVTINVRSLELLGGKTDEIPSVLYDASNGAQVDVKKYFGVPALVRKKTDAEFVTVVDRNQTPYLVDRAGWVTKFQEG